MHEFGFDIKKINEKLSELQDSSINRGGTWEARVFNKLELNDDALSVLIREFKNSPEIDNLSLYQEYADKGEWNPEEKKLTTNLELVELTDWKSYFEQRIEYWSFFESIWKEAAEQEFNQDLFSENKKKFKDLLFKYLESKNLLGAYKINENKFDTYYIWREQMCEDFIFELESEILTISFGWSS